MSLARRVADRLQADMKKRVLAKLAAFHLVVDEREQLGPTGSRSRSVEGRLTLIWNDGSVSSLTVTDALDTEDLGDLAAFTPRFLRKDSRWLYKPGERVRTPVQLVDPLITDCLQSGRLPEVPKGFSAEIALERRTVIHSHGLHAEETATACRWMPDRPGIPSGYHSRRWPPEKHALYLEMEAAWYRPFAAETAPRPAAPEPREPRHGILLFAPDAFRKLLDAGLMVTYRNDPTLAARLLHRLSARTTIAVRSDPLVPWAIGSRGLTHSGAPAKTIPLFAPGGEASFVLPPSAAPAPRPQGGATLHWNLPRKEPFRAWLSRTPDVWLIADVQVPERFSPLQPTAVWVPAAICFRQGRPAGCQGLLFSLVLARLLGSPRLIGVEKIGWDCCGVAVPAGQLAHDS